MTFYKNNIAPVQLIKFAALNSDVDVMAIKPYDVFKSILGIKNSHQNIANNVKSNNCKLTSEKDAALIKPEFSAFITEHLQNVFIAAKNANNPLEKNNLANLTAANNQLHYAGNDIAKFTNQNDGIKVEPTYAAPYDSVEKQQYTSNDVYYDAEGYSIVGQDKHIYEQIFDYVLEEGEQMENEIYYDARGENKEHIYDTIPDNFTTDEQRNKITRLAEQTFAPPKSFIARLTSSIWNALFGTKNEPKIVPPAELVARAMQINIDGICHALNKSIAEKEVDGIFRQMPNNSIYKKDDPEKLIKVFNNDDCYSDPIALAWMVKLYINENMSKITTEEFDIIKKQHNKPDKLNCLIKEKIDQINCDKTKNNLKACFTIIVNVLKLGRELEAKGEKNNQFSSVNIVGSMLTGLVKQPEEFVTKELHSEGFFFEGFVAKESYNNEYANKLYAAK